MMDRLMSGFQRFLLGTGSRPVRDRHRRRTGHGLSCRPGVRRVPAFDGFDHLSGIMQAVERRLQQVQSALETSLAGGDGGAVLRSAEELVRLADCRSALAAAVRHAPEAGAKRFVVSSWFLFDMFRALTRRPEEDVFYITGVERHGEFHLQKAVHFELARQSVAGAAGDPDSCLRALVAMDEFGHRMGAHFHSHPGRGPGATLHSSVDDRYQSRLERGGYMVIGAVFSRDAYVRFFSHQLKFTVAVLGDRAREVEHNVFRLEGPVEGLQVQDPEAEVPGRGRGF